MKDELWKSIPGWEGLYEASNLGTIRSVARTSKRKFNGNVESEMFYEPRVLKPMSTKFDYLKYGLSRNGKTVSYVGHRLVAATWIPNPNNLPQVHHKDHNKHNNAVDNLEWISPSDNVKAAIAAGKHHGGFKQGVKHHHGKFTKDQIDWMKILSTDGYTYTDLEKIFGSSRGYISQVINGLRRNNPNKEEVGFQIYCKTMPVYSVTPELF